MSTDVNVYVYKTSNLLFLAAPAGQVKAHSQTHMIRSNRCRMNVSACFSLRMSPNAPQQSAIALYSKTAHPH